MMIVMKKSWFLALGGFDPGMKLWGSEQFEISVKARLNICMLGNFSWCFFQVFWRFCVFSLFVCFLFKLNS